MQIPAVDFLATKVRAHTRLFTAAVIALALTAWGTVGYGVWFMTSIMTELPDATALRSIGSMAQSTTVLDAADRPSFTIFKEQRVEVPLNRVSPHLVRAVLAIEDQRFFDHAGVDVIRLAGAALKNIEDGWGTQGASTITQQLARQSLLSPEKTLRRKLKEVVVASRLEREFNKDQILELYLNKVYFGDGLHGVEAASLGYFGKHAMDLELAEAALLAGLIRSPSTHAPTVNAERALNRRNAVLQTMLSAGVIDRPSYDQAVATKVALNDALGRSETFGQYFKEEVRLQLVERFGWARVYQGGLRVYTTLDVDLQKAAEEQVARALGEIEQRQRRNGGVPEGVALQAALVAMDPRTGEVRALVGGRDFEESHFNRAIQAKRQPGSAFKPLVYAAALERGYSPATIIRALDMPIATLQGAWIPDDHTTNSAMTLRDALRTSSNRAAVRLLLEVGISNAVRSAERLGVGSMPGVPSLALGSGEVTLMSLTAAYATFANEGMRPSPSLIRRVETVDGEVLYTSNTEATRAVSPTTAFLMSSMMSDVVNRGTGWQARRVGFDLPAAGKTGTTNEYRDVWFIGYTKSLATGVWLGYDQPRTIVGGGYAGDLAVPLWGRFMEAATRNDKPEPFRPPRGVRPLSVCRLTGKLATSDCYGSVDFDGESVRRVASVYTEYFASGSEPTEYCDHPGHRPQPIAATVLNPRAQPGAPTLASPPPVMARQPQAAVPAAGSAPPTATAEAARTPEEQPRRRGFWGFLGFGRDRSQDEATPPPSVNQR